MSAPKRRSLLTLKTFPQYISCAKIIVVEIASFIGLVALLFHGLMKEFRW
jgi:hypothetical protein